MRSPGSHLVSFVFTRLPAAIFSLSQILIVAILIIAIPIHALPNSKLAPAPGLTRRLNAAEVVQAGDLKVRLGEFKSPVSVSGMDIHYPGQNPRKLSTFQSLELVFSPDEKETKNHVWRLYDRATHELLSEMRAPFFAIEGTSIRVNLKPAPEQIYFAARDRGGQRTPRVKDHFSQVDLIGHMEMEDYLAGVLPAEMPASWPLEALKAQAVAARTYALYRRQMRELAHASYHLESSVMDQVFLAPSVAGVAKDLGRPSGLSDSGRSLTNVQRALAETRGIVLLDQMSRPFATYFHADCGGHTEEAGNIWHGEPSIGTATDDGCPLSPMAKWKTQLSLADMAARLRKLASVSPRSELFEIAASDRSKSGRINQLVLTWSNQTRTQISGQEFRMAMGFERIRSTNFQIARSAIRSLPSYEFYGRGYGHGVGMCQWGAKYLALHGHGYQEILKHYYPKAELSRPSLARRD